MSPSSCLSSTSSNFSVMEIPQNFFSYLACYVILTRAYLGALTWVRLPLEQLKTCMGAYPGAGTSSEQPTAKRHLGAHLGVGALPGDYTVSFVYIVSSAQLSAVCILVGNSSPCSNPLFANCFRLKVCQ